MRKYKSIIRKNGINEFYNFINKIKDMQIIDEQEFQV